MIVLLSACGRAPTSPSGSLPFVSESATMRYFHEAGDTVEIERQEEFNAWALSRLGMSPPQCSDLGMKHKHKANQNRQHEARRSCH